MPTKFHIWGNSAWVKQSKSFSTFEKMVSRLQAKGPTPSCLDCTLIGNSSLQSAPTKNIKPSKDSNSAQKKLIKKVGKQEHHLWSKRDSSGSGQKALNLVRIVSGLPNEKEAVYGALDKWTAWETEFPLIAAAKALQILKKRNQWTRVIQVAKWMLGKGQGMTMGTFDTLLLAFDMDGRVDEAESFWNMILHTHTRSISKRLFSRMIWLYDHHNKPDKVIEVFADMEELGVKPDEDTTKKIAHAFQKQGQEDKQKEVLKRYLGRWKYIHFNGERVRVKRALWNE
ncbi:pentatricopeptide repeat-containing protein At4g18975, chloroplastic isoform X2 [Daucus carota subsp. sativus]|uniref:pentatricopeptide repeat-containing protein At4g18975, chloroplastic isoform X2 n=1 Tax=Daucus carota subsp. sativus TaxID=79200 RepID=UPI0007EFF642|nr:PREDICTED: pentatricopeptide repeat-containing protein At4g18975, chloroplastic isoform X2 [Daucus carota subsp. sativus]